MVNSILGSQITKFRKASMLTQEELGRAVGVSTQAVSRWENGGAPDVTLLPAIADKLGVSIDALFGREDIDGADAEQLALRWGSGVKRDRLVTELNRLIWNAGIKYVGREVVGVAELPYLQSCQNEIRPGQKTLLCSNFSTDDGIFFGVGAEDMAFSMVCPRPDLGYSAYFCTNDNSRRLFAVFARPGCLEVMQFMLSRRELLFAPQTLAAEVGMALPEVAPLLVEMEQVNLIGSTQVVMPDGPAKIYQVRNDGSLVPLLYLTKAILEGNAFYLNYDGCSKPLL